MNTKEAVENAATLLGTRNPPQGGSGAVPVRAHLHMYEYKMSDQYLFRGCITCGESHLASVDAGMSRLEWHRIKEIEE